MDKLMIRLHHNAHKHTGSEDLRFSITPEGQVVVRVGPEGGNVEGAAPGHVGALAACGLKLCEARRAQLTAEIAKVDADEAVFRLAAEGKREDGSPF